MTHNTLYNAAALPCEPLVCNDLPKRKYQQELLTSLELLNINDVNTYKSAIEKCLLTLTDAQLFSISSDIVYVIFNRIFDSTLEKSDKIILLNFLFTLGANRNLDQNTINRTIYNMYRISIEHDYKFM